MSKKKDVKLKDLLSGENKTAMKKTIKLKELLNEFYLGIVYPAVVNRPFPTRKKDKFTYQVKEEKKELELKESTGNFLHVLFDELQHILDELEKSKYISTVKAKLLRTELEKLYKLFQRELKNSGLINW